MTTLTSGQKAARTRKLSQAAHKAWQTRRKNTVKNTVRQTVNNPEVFTSVQARDLHKEVNKLSHRDAIQMLHTMINFARGKNV